MLSQTLHTGCVIWQNASPNKALLWLCIHSLHTLNLFSSMKYSAFESSGQRIFADWVSSTLQSLFPSRWCIFCLNLVWCFTSLQEAPWKIHWSQLNWGTWCADFSVTSDIFVGSVSLPLFDSLLGWTSLSNDSRIELSSFATASSQ